MEKVYLSVLDQEEYKKYLEWKNMDEQGKLLKLPCAIGDTVYVVTNGTYIFPVLDGDMYAPDGSIGDATGYYCPYELNGKCPHESEEYISCEECQEKLAVFEDTVSSIEVHDEDVIYISCENTGMSSQVGELVFLTEQEAKEALERMEK